MREQFTDSKQTRKEREGPPGGIATTKKRPRRGGGETPTLKT